MTTVKELVTEMIHYRTSTYPPPAVDHSHILPLYFSPNTNFPIPTTSWRTSIVQRNNSLSFSPPHFMTKPSSVATTPPVTITPTQAKHQIHREVNNLVKQSTSLTDAEVALTPAMETTINTTIIS